MNGDAGGIHPQPLGKSDSTDAILPRTYFVIIWTHRLQSLLLSLCTVQQFGGSESQTNGFGCLISADASVAFA